MSIQQVRSVVSLRDNFDFTIIYLLGAFALFGPGQFNNLYPHVTKPVGGVLHFAGEAASVHHA